MHWHLFGDSTRKLSNEETLFSDSFSSLDGIEKNIVLDQKSNHLIITDGQINKGQKFEDLIIDNNNIYIAGFGDEIENLDCYIASVAPYEDSKKDLVSLSINIGCFIDEETSLPLDIILTNDKNETILLDKKVLKFNQSGFKDILLENINRNVLSVFNKIEFQTSLNELSHNNYKYFIIKEKEEVKKVLLLTGGVSSNTKFIKNLIKNKFSNFKIDHYFQNNKINYNLLDEYSLIILDNFPFSNNHLEDYHHIINDFSETPIIYFQGPGLSFPIADRISQSLGLDIRYSKDKNSNLEVVNSHFLFNSIDFNKIPPTNKNILWEIEDVIVNIPVTYFSNESIATVKNEKLLAVFISNLFNSSLIEANLFNTTNVIEYIYNVILYEYESDSKLISLNIDEWEQSNNNLINAYINISPKIINTNFYMNIYDLLNKSNKKLAFKNKMINNYTHSFTINEPGSYSIQISSEFDNTRFESNKEYLAINSFDIESEFLYQNKKSLHNFSNQNNADYFNFNNLEENLKNISINKIIDVKQSNFNSLSTQYYWVLFIFILAIEWYLRKRSKLL